MSDPTKRLVKATPEILSRELSEARAEIAALTEIAAEARRAIEMWDPYSDRWGGIPYDNSTIKALLLRSLASPPARS